MLYIVLGIIVLGLVAAAIGFLENLRMRRLAERGLAVPEKDAEAVVPAECCGRHEVCERDSLLAAVSKKVEYYDDEELDEYKGVASCEYSERAADEFREVLYTLREAEVAGWLRSLQLRGVNLPDQLKDEALLIVEERREAN